MLTPLAGRPLKWALLVVDEVDNDGGVDEFDDELCC